MPSSRKLLTFKWEPKYGPAFVTGLFNMIVFGLGWLVLWANLPNDIKAANASIAELKAITATHENKLTKTETAIEFIVPALKRIEEKVDKNK